MTKNLIVGALIAATIFQVAPKANANGTTDKLIIGGIIGAIVGGAVANDRNDRRNDRRDDRRDDRWGRGPRRPGPDRGYPPPYRPAPPPQRSQADVQINQITRQGGGAWYRLSLRYPLALTDVDVRVFNAGLKIHEAVIVTDRQERIPLYELSNSPVLGQGQYINQYINLYDRVLAIDIRAESFGGYADIAVGVSSNEGYPEISVYRY